MVEDVKRVVVVEDHDGYRAALKAGLAAEGVEVIAEADEGQSALGVLRALTDAGAQVDAVITDYEMSDMNGLTLARTVSAFWPEVPVLFITGHDQAVVLDAALHAGALRAFIKTPDLPAQLAAALRSSSATPSAS
jgi:DNA-binding NarL/FixJ family response regulator